MYRYIRKSMKPFIAFSFVSMLGAVSVVFMAYIINLLVETITEGKFENFIWIAVLSFVYVLIDSYLDYAVDVVNERLTQELMYHIREDLLESIESQSIVEFEKLGRDYYLNMYTKDLETIESDYIKELLSMYNDVWVFILGFVSAIVISPLFAILMIGLSSLPFALPYFSRKILGNAKLNLSQINEKYLSLLTEIFDSFTTLKVYDVFPLFNKRLRSKSRDLVEAKVYVTHTNKFVYAISYGLRMFVNVFSWVLGGYFVLNHSVTLAVFFTIKQLTQYVAYPIQGFGASYTEVVAAKSVKDKVFEIIDQRKVNVVKEESNIQKIIFEDFSVNFDEKLIFQHLNLQLEKGKKYLLIGESGSGKSTFLKSLIGSIPVENHSLKFQLENGKLLDSSELEKISHQISYIGQETSLFQLSLKENISLQNSITDGQFQALCKQVGLEKWADQSTEFDSILSTASGGEKRRIDLARLLFFDREILLFDEPTAGLDSQNRLKVEEVVKQLENKLIVYSTHQYDEEFMQQFDYCLEIQDGSIVMREINA